MIRIFLLLLFAGAGWVGWKAYVASGERAAEARVEREELPVAVEVAPVESGLIREVRTLSGTLEASTRFDVASKVGGRLVALRVELGDEVRRGQVVAEIADEEFVHAVAQMQAEVAVEGARRDQARIATELAERDKVRFEGLRERGVASESEIDAIVTHVETARAALALAEADVRRAQASLELAQLHLADTHVRAHWEGDREVGLVGVRHEDAGSTIQPGAPLVSVVVLDPLTVAVAVTERDYARLALGQPATLETDAFSGRSFDAEVERIAPVFRESSRQARLELRVANPDGALKPGMFVRVRIVLREAQAEALVPTAALVRRQGEDVVFVVAPDGETVRRVPVTVGIVEGDRAQVFGVGLSGRVVTLGQQLVGDGSRVFVVAAEDETVAPQAEGDAPAGTGASE